MGDNGGGVRRVSVVCGGASPRFQGFCWGWGWGERGTSTGVPYRRRRMGWDRDGDLFRESGWGLRRGKTEVEGRKTVVRGTTVRSRGR